MPHLRQSHMLIPWLLLATTSSVALRAPSPVHAEEVQVVTPAAGRHLMVQVPAGPFLMGNPVRTVILSSAYNIDKFEVSNALYEGFVAATGAAPLETMSDTTLNKPDYPVVGMTWQEAADYCAWVGLRLPTEAEWEKAARGTDGRAWPWGNEAPTPTLMNMGKDASSGDYTHYEGDASDGYLYSAPVDSYPQGASPYGAYNMVGNVTEWTSDWYGPLPGDGQVDPKGPATGTDMVAKGSNYASPPVVLFKRYSPTPWSRGGWLGFRCAQSVSAMPTAVSTTGWGQLKMEQVSIGCCGKE